jgi:hypothetical protein
VETSEGRESAPVSTPTKGLCWYPWNTRKSKSKSKSKKRRKRTRNRPNNNRRQTQVQPTPRKPTTATSTTTYPTGTDVNTNGLLNNYEGTTAGTVNYASTYKDYALTNTINVCADFDGDGIKDIIDIDDDNDGVLDAVESPTCFFTALEMENPKAVTTDLAPYSTNTIENSIDGSGTTYSAFAPSVNWVGKELFNFTATSTIAISGMSFDLFNWAISNGAAIIMILGVNPNPS